MAGKGLESEANMDELDSEFVQMMNVTWPLLVSQNFLVCSYLPGTRILLLFCKTILDCIVITNRLILAIDSPKNS